MSGIAGIKNPKKHDLVELMVQKMSHRGWAWSEISETQESVIGMNGLKIQENALTDLKLSGLAKDGCVPGRFAQAQSTSKGFILKRDPIGAAPLYYGKTDEGEMCFASEVKALQLATRDIHELPPGCMFDGQKITPYFQLSKLELTTETPEVIAITLRQKLQDSIDKSIGDGNVGAWLSGGLDSSIMAALAKKRVPKLHTFAAGLPEAPDLKFARIMADHIQSEHHEVVVSLNEILNVLPEVIYYLESFDSLLIRSSILNFLVARHASHFVPAVFSGEGGDELFAGYEYLKKLAPSQIPDELIDIIGRLHNTALQRVDRCASAHGTLPHVGFLDPAVVEYALQIPSGYKLRGGVEKWILRQAVADLLPEPILNRTKAKFWEGGGFEDLILNYAEEKVTNNDFKKERELPNGWRLNTKEELLFYRIFKLHFGELKDLSWMGRTKGAPVDRV